ncbi:MAG TPA: hypothetical protein VLG76_06500 [Rhabdochlamydiaceae bacterium]|nr:hypothetical protein [Rhabdochlamydiaceae bacterium]
MMPSVRARTDVDVESKCCNDCTSSCNISCSPWSWCCCGRRKEDSPGTEIRRIERVVQVVEKVIERRRDESKERSIVQ